MALVVSDEDLEEIPEFANVVPDERPNPLRDRVAVDLDLRAQIEAVIFASSKCVKPIDLLEIIGEEVASITEIERELDELVAHYAERSGGFALEHVRGHGYQFRTVSCAGPLMERLFASKPRPLSRAALETLSIIAYRQPATRADIEFVRGVDAGSIIKNLLERGLVKCVGRKEEAGRPMLFGTTDEFLAVFRIGSLKELPPLSAFQPSHDSMSKAFEQLDGEEKILPEGEDFVGEQSEDTSVSEGLVSVEGETEEIQETDCANSSIDEESVLEAGAGQSGISTPEFDNEVDHLAEENVAEEPVTRAGGELAAESFESDGNADGNNQDSEMAIATGDCLEARSGALDSDAEDIG